MRRQPESNGVSRGERQDGPREDEKRVPNGDSDHHDGEGGQIDEGRGQSCSMQAQRIQRIRGNYQGETRELPSGQDWPRSHSGVEERVDVVQERGPMMEDRNGPAEGGGDA